MDFDTIDDLFNRHDEIFSDTYQKMSCNGQFFPTDLYTTAIINRAIAINSAYVKLARANNYIAATSYIRMQMDNCLYCYAGYLVKDVLGLVNHYVSGKDLYKFKDKKRNCLYEKYLVQEMNKQFANFKQAYDFYNKDIHLSYKHFVMANNMIGENKMKIAFNSDNEYGDQAIRAYHENMRIFNKILIRLLLMGWLPYKQQQLNIIEHLQIVDKMSFQEIIKNLLKDYPSILELLSNHHKS